MDKRKVPTKNYIILGVIYLVVILIVIYISDWYKKSDFNNNNSITKVVSEIKLEEFTSYIQENPDIIIYFNSGLNNDVKVQQKIGNYIVKNNLTNDVVYINTYNVPQEWFDNVSRQYFSDNLNFKLCSGTDNMIVFSDGKIIDYAAYSTKTLTYDDVVKFLIRYGDLNND